MEKSEIDDLVVEAKAIVTVDAEWHIYAPGYLAVRDGTIVAAGPLEEGKKRDSRNRLDARESLLMPGFINTHTHISMAAFKGACEDIPDRLTRCIFPMERDLVTPGLTYWSALYCLCEMAKSGTTCFADMYYFEHEVAEATAEAGLRALLGETILGQAAPDAPVPYGGLEYARRFIETWNHNDRIRPCIAPHAPYTVDAKHLSIIRDEALRLDSDIMMHVAEMDFEHSKFAQEYGSVLRYLDSIEGFLSPKLLAAHMLFVDDEDIALAKARGLRVAHCPTSNAKSGRPICPAWKMQNAGIPLGLATDGPLSGNGMDLQNVVSLFPKLQKTRERDRSIVPARQALRTATLGGAEALGIGSETGSIEPGKKADFILVDLNDFNIGPIYDWYSTIVYSLKPHNVTDVYVDGKAVVKNGTMENVDEREIKSMMGQLSERCSSYISLVSRTL
jgi:cytosine/adenosine deaminase-related metal-dependent hydrolase